MSPTLSSERGEQCIYLSHNCFLHIISFNLHDISGRWNYYLHITEEETETLRDWITNPKISETEPLPNHSGFICLICTTPLKPWISEIWRTMFYTLFHSLTCWEKRYVFTKIFIDWLQSMSSVQILTET